MVSERAIMFSDHLSEYIFAWAFILPIPNKLGAEAGIKSKRTVQHTQGYHDDLSVSITSAFPAIKGCFVALLWSTVSVDPGSFAVCLCTCISLHTSISPLQLFLSQSAFHYYRMKSWWNKRSQQVLEVKQIWCHSSPHPASGAQAAGLFFFFLTLKQMQMPRVEPHSLGSLISLQL
jgi:hypothetical protein